jgi:hypothetical protein
MDRSNVHAHTVYRCFELTCTSNVPALENTGVAATAIKKVLQQIAFYFKFRPVEKVWAAKDAVSMLQDAAMWRCIAHLINWGKAGLCGGARFLSVALFHIAHYIYMHILSNGAESASFEIWHIHVWRPVYMATFREAGFFGKTQEWAAAFFVMEDGLQWVNAVRGMAMSFCQILIVSESRGGLDLRGALAQGHINTEGALLHMLLARSSSHKLPKVIQTWLSFLRFNIASVSHLIPLLNKFERELCHAASEHKSRREHPNQRVQIVNMAMGQG